MTAPSGFVSVSLPDSRRVAELSTTDFLVWGGLVLAAPRYREGMPRRWVLDRAGLDPTPDRVKKLPGRLRSIAAAGLLVGVAVDGDRVRFDVAAVDCSGDADRWDSRLYRVDLRRAGDAADPLTPADLRAWLCRWQPVVRRHRVRVGHADLAARWGMARESVVREAGRLAGAGLLGMRRTGREMVAWDARHTPADGPILDLTEQPRCDASGTADVTRSAPAAGDALSFPRAYGSTHSALHTVSARQCRSASKQPREDEAGAGGPGAGKPTTTTKPRRRHDPATAGAWQLVWSTRWLAAAPQRVRCQLARMLANRLRRGGTPGAEDAWTLDHLRPALEAADPGEWTDQHARIVRAALAGVVADAKADSTDPEWNDPVEDEHTPAEVYAMAAESLAAAGTQSNNHDDHQQRVSEWRHRLLRLAETGPPTDSEQVPDFLAGVVLAHHDRTGLPVSAIAAKLRARVGPEHADALSVAAGTAAMITNAAVGEAVPA